MGRHDTFGRCSALIKLVPDLPHRTGNLFVGHSTWEGMEEAVRMWKVYDFPFIVAHEAVVSFSSYPGCISSTDDFYQTKKSQLLITETSLNVAPGSNAYDRVVSASGISDV